MAGNPTERAEPTNLAERMERMAEPAIPTIAVFATSAKAGNPTERTEQTNQSWLSATAPASAMAGWLCGFYTGFVPLQAGYLAQPQNCAPARRPFLAVRKAMRPPQTGQGGGDGAEADGAG